MIFEFKGKKYVMARKLREFRSIDNPTEIISFKSSKGWQILNSL